MARRRAAPTAAAKASAGRAAAAARRQSGPASGAARSVDLSAPLTRERALALQASAGNRAVALLVARTSHDLPGGATVQRTPFLTAAQVARARAYYTRRGYTAATVGEIRRAVGAPPGERMDDEAIQAVARWQAGADRLAADGIAAERTLAQLFPSGLASDASVAAFEQDRTALTGTWSSLPTPEARMNALLRIANERLQALGVPPMRAGEGRGGTTVAGTFHHPSWTLTIHPGSLAATAASTVEHVTLTVYHEARHAEQHFLMARTRAGAGLDPAGITRELGVPDEVAQQAHASPIAPGTPLAVTANGWIRAVHGSRTARLYARMRRLREAFYRAQDAHADNPTRANERRLAQAERAYNRADRAHQNAASHEHDAYAVERRLHMTHV